MDEIYLVGGPLHVWRDAAGSVETLVYLHDSDDALAAKYLAATAQYLEMYRQLIGPYPYRKFALVENFWETGYGMPTFTLLGQRDHPVPVHHQLVLSARDPPQLVGQLGLRGLRVGQLVRGADGVPGGPPHRRSSGAPATSTAARRCRSTATTSRTGATSR